MSEEKKKPIRPEMNFLPPLKMVLAFLDQNEKDRNAKQETSDERNVEKLIEKLSEKEDE